MNEEFFKKESFNIKDFAKIVKKGTQTIRSWELKGIINKPIKKTNDRYEWREYTKETLADTLESVINFNWDRNVIKNKSEIQYAIDRLRGKASATDLNVMGERDE